VGENKPFSSFKRQYLENVGYTTNVTINRIKMTNRKSLDTKTDDLGSP